MTLSRLADLEAFADRYWQDFDEGIERTTESYQALFPRAHDAIPAELAALRDFVNEPDPSTPAPTLPSAAAGARFGEYVIRRSLGRGGMGAVYAATGPDGRDVAIKVIRSTVKAQADTRRRFDREIRAAASIDHPNVLRPLDWGVIEGRAFMATPLIATGSLADRLAKDSMDAETTVSIARDILDGLTAVHGAGWLHRDIKPANVLLDRGGKALLADLGLARSRIGGATSLQTASNIVLGTANYGAPEQLLARGVDQRSDLYSAGATLYHCLTGRPPHRYRHLAQILEAGRDPAPDVRGLAAGCPDRLAELVMALLERDPTRRPADAATAREALDDLPARAPASGRRSAARGGEVARTVLAALLGVSGVRSGTLLGLRPLAEQEPVLDVMDAGGSPAGTAVVHPGHVIEMAVSDLTHLSAMGDQTARLIIRSEGETATIEVTTDVGIALNGQRLVPGTPERLSPRSELTGPDFVVAVRVLGRGGSGPSVAIARGDSAVIALVPSRLRLAPGTSVIHMNGTIKLVQETPGS